MVERLNMKGFFSDSAFTTETKPLRFPECGTCGLYRGCQSPKMEPTGKGRKGILIVGESPGVEEDAKGIQFIGKSGQYLRKVLRKIGIDLEEDCWKTNAVICHPPNNKTTRNHMRYCQPNLLNTIERLKPTVIIPLGKMATESLIGWLWKEDFGSMGRWVGWRIPCRRYNAWICPTYHPSYALRQNDPMLDRTIEDHLRKAFEYEERPAPVSDYRKKILIYLEIDRVVTLIGAVSSNIDSFGPIAFDYETNMLKPDSKNARIISCAIRWKEGCVAYPWHGKAIEATGRLLKSPIPKIAANMKFEDRWTRKEFGHGVRNWHWDTMLAAHVLDNRSSISSLKFQAFVKLGQENYDHHIRPFLKGGEDGTNRIEELDLKELLLYNGMDALLEYELAMLQMGEMR